MSFHIPKYPITRKAIIEPRTNCQLLDPIQAKIAIAQAYAAEVQTRLAVDTKQYEWLQNQQVKLQADYDKGVQIIAGQAAQ